MKVDTKLESDDNETARYLAEYLKDNSKEFLSRSSDDGIDRNALFLTIKKFYDSLP